MKRSFNEESTLKKLKHFLPAQVPIKDYVQYNNLHPFQDLEFYEALRKSAHMLGNRTLFSLKEFREKYQNGKISKEAISEVLKNNKPKNQQKIWWDKMFQLEEPTFFTPRIGKLRKHWETDYGVDMDGMVRPNIMRLINSYLDQGIAFENFPKTSKSLLDAVIYIQENSFAKLLQSPRAIKLLYKEDKKLSDLLYLIVGNEEYYEQYLFDQQFTHPGISGMVTTMELKPDSIYDKRPIKLFDFIYLELLFELESLEKFVSKNFRPLAIGVDFPPEDIFAKVEKTEYWQVLELWQEAFELHYHDQVLAGIATANKEKSQKVTTQAFFCIDDREESIRRNIEMIHPECQTFGTPAHFNVVARFKPEKASFSTKICPGPFTPQHLIKEKDRKKKHINDIHFQNHSHKFMSGFFISQTVGFWSTVKLFTNIFKPKETAAQYNAPTDHMDYNSQLIYENKSGEKEDGYQVGFTVKEMINLVSEELTKNGLVDNFANLIYFFGHGGSSTNNPYFSAYNCGACSGRPSTVNARVFALMANREDVRKGIIEKGISIPETTHFIGSYHDTTQDTFAYFDEDLIPHELRDLHRENKAKFEKALDNNAKERAREFRLINIKREANKVHRDVKKRAVVLFEPRPEYDHCNNSLYIVGSRNLSKNLFLDQRAFLNSYDYKIDEDGKLLELILNAGTGVCGGINLNYFFSTVDNEKIGAGSKLPQNVVGLYGVANGVKGDLRPGLAWQMIDIHDPIRILTIIENTPELVLEVLKRNPTTFDWYEKGWMKLTTYNPYNGEIHILKNGEFIPYQPITKNIEEVSDFEKIFESNNENLPVYKIKTTA